MPVTRTRGTGVLVVVAGFVATTIIASASFVGFSSARMISSHRTTSPSNAHTLKSAPIVQRVYWDLFNGQNQSYMIESIKLPLTSKSVDTEITGTSLNRLRCTSGMTTDNKGRLWVISYPNGCSAPDLATLQVFTLPVTVTSAPVLSFTLPGTGDDDTPVFDHSGNLWVSDAYNRTIMKFVGPFNASRTLVASVTLSLGAVHPSGIALDAKGNLFVANAASNGNHSIAMYRAPVTSTSRPSFLNGLVQPGGITFDASGNLYASNNPTNGVGAAIVRFNATHLASGSNPSIVDRAGVSGKPYEAAFSWDSSGNLYVADCGNHASIRYYHRALTNFSSHLAPSATYVNTSLTTIGCAWGIAVH